MSIFDCFNAPDRSDSLDSPLINADPLHAPTSRQRLAALAQAVEHGGYADDRACREQRWLGWLCWLVAYGRIGGAGDGGDGAH